MGAKLYYTHEINGVHHDESRTFMNLQNWRALREHKHRDTKGLFIITSEFRMYFIPALTIEQFNIFNSTHQKIDLNYEYIKNVLSCEKCNGKAKTDWVTHARGKQDDHRSEYQRQLDYVRHKLGKVHLVNPGGDYPPYHVSTVFLHRGEEHCKDCSGSGLLFAQPWAVKETITFKQS